MIARLKKKIGMILTYGWAARNFEWPPARVIKRAWDQKMPVGPEVARWWFACGDCLRIFPAKVMNISPNSFHPPCPGCEEKARAWLEGRNATREEKP